MQLFSFSLPRFVWQYFSPSEMVYTAINNIFLNIHFGSEKIKINFLLDRETTALNADASAIHLLIIIINNIKEGRKKKGGGIGGGRWAFKC